MSDQQHPPVYSTYQHDPDQLVLPAVPQTDPARPWQQLPPVAREPIALPGARGHLRLPPIQSLLADDQMPQLRLPDVPQSLPGMVNGSRETDMSSPMDVDDVAGNTPSTEERSGRAGSIVSMDDPDVRIAAEALGDLRADFVQSPPHSHTALSDHASSLSPTASSADFGSSQQPEPLLSLLTTSHPMLSNAITGSLSAYSTSKNISPRFVKYGAELMERSVASTMGSVGRRTGVEDSVRRYLGGRPSTPQPWEADGEETETSTKRRKVSDERDLDIDVERGLNTPSPRATLLPVVYADGRVSEESSAESLPAYDDHRSPSYEERGPLVTGQHQRPDSPSTPNATWQSRLMMSTSGLGVAMSEESLKRLKFCLEWLRGANGLIGNAIVELRSALAEWDRAHLAREQSSAPSTSTLDTESNLASKTLSDTWSGNQMTPSSAASDDELNQRIKKWKQQITNTLKKAVEVVSTYTGAALPENARRVVRSQLTSLPWRFQRASRAASTDDATAAAAAARLQTSGMASSAHRVIVLAREGLDMIAQVCDVLNGTIVSAEAWCDRLGRRRAEGSPPPDGAVNGQPQSHQQQQQQQLPPPLPPQQQLLADVKLPELAPATPKQADSGERDERMGGC